MSTPVPEARRDDRRRDMVALLALIAATIALCIPLSNHYGITYDEPWYGGKAIYALEWLGELIRHPRAAVSRGSIDAYWWARKGERHEEQPGAYKLILALTLWATKGLLPGMASVRAATCLVLVLGIAAVYAFARRAYGRTEAVVACAALILMPRLFAHAHLAALDVPVAALSMATLYAAWRTAVTGSWWWTAACGVVFGVALGTKVNAVLVPVIALIWLLLCGGRLTMAKAAAGLGSRARQQGGSQSTRDSQGGQGAAGLGSPAPQRRRIPLAVAQLAIAFVVIGPVVFVALWPWLWHDTVQRLQDYALFQLQHYPVSTYYFGTTYVRAPWHYPFVMTLITMPPLTLLLVLVGAARLAGPVWRRSPGSTLVAVGIAINLLVAALPGTPKYNGVRLFMPVFPLLAIVAGAGFGQMMTVVSGQCSVLSKRHVKGQRQSGKSTGHWLLATDQWGGIAVAIVLLGPAARAVAVTHPYELSYYNVLVGGLRGAVARGLPATYWGDTYLDAWYFLTHAAPPDAAVWIAPPGCISILETYQHMGRRPDIKLITTASVPPQADFAVFQNKPNELNTGCRALLRAMEEGVPAAHLTERCEVPLLYVFDRRAIQAIHHGNSR